MIRRELAVFLVVGTLTVVVDYLGYRVLAGSGLLDTPAAKAAGFLAGTVFAYVANRFWTFGRHVHAAGSVVRFGILYALTLGVNVLVNSAALVLLDNPAIRVPLAFLLATGTSATLNFIGMKFFVFRQATASGEK